MKKKQIIKYALSLCVWKRFNQRYDGKKTHKTGNNEKNKIK